jgi:hypothetical protein
VLTPTSKPVLYFPTAQNEITGTHISISNQQGRKITSNSCLECEHSSIIKDWHNHSKCAKEPLCRSPAALLITLETMDDIREAGYGIMPVVLPNRTATAHSGPHNYL